nr:dihydrolipoamide acetyltransferase family protein [Micromonospora sp. DSM 115978]
MATLLRMPAITANATEAVLSEWPVAENVAFGADDPIATVETEKAVVDVPAEAAGVILKTLVAPGATVEVGMPIALLGEVGETVDNLDAVLASVGVRPPEAEAPSPAPAVGPDGAARSAPDGESARVFASPLARRLAREAGLSTGDLTGSGPGGRIVRRDVERAINARRQQDGAGTPAKVVPTAVPPSDPTPTAGPVVRRAADPEQAGYQEVPHSRMRRAIAARLTESSQEAPHFAVRGSARVDKLLRLREQINATAPTRISVNDFIVLAAARAHTRVPEMNVIWTPDAVRAYSSVDVGIAIATDRGLVTPVLRGVERLSVSAVAVATADLIGRARQGRLRQPELEGGTFTVTNLGGYGTEEFTAIINPPQSAILAVGAARPEPVVRKGRLAVATVLRVTLSVDHRPIDGAVAARWMAAFLALLENPLSILA